MKLGPKLIAAPLATAVLVLGTGVAAEWWMLRSQAEVQAVQRAHEDDFKTLTSVQDQLARLHAGNYRTLALMASLDEAAVKKARADLALQLDGAKRTLGALGGSESALGAQITQATAQIQRYLKQSDNALDMAGVDPNTGVAAMQQADATFGELARTAGAMVETLSTQLEEVSAQAETRSRRTLLAGASLGLLVSVLAVAGAWLLQRRLVQDLARAAELAHQVAAGRLDATAASTRDDEVGDVLRALDRMTASLGESLRVVQDSSVSIHTASREIASGNTDLSQRTEQAAGSLQRTAGAVEQLTGALTASADATRQANQLAAGAAQVAQRGGEVVAQVVSTMDEISASSRRIGDIIGTIDGIAFQTNILALNAAVEAARAGEQGRGFAVVAGEVRSLAQRSAAAAREIKSLIGSSVDRVESGARLVADAGSTMGEIVTSVQRVADIIGEVTAATTEQSAGVGDINQAVGQLDQMTQQNAALVEQSAAAAESLQSQAGRLAEVVQRFTLGAAAAPAAHPL